MDPFELISGLLPAIGGTAGSLIGGPLGGQIGGALGSLGSTALEAAVPDPNTPTPARIQAPPESPGSTLTGFRSTPIPSPTAPPSMPQPEISPVRTAQPQGVGPMTSGFDLDRARRLELLRELVGDLRA